MKSTIMFFYMKRHGDCPVLTGRAWSLLSPRRSPRRVVWSACEQLLPVTLKEIIWVPMITPLSVPSPGTFLILSVQPESM